MTLLTIRAYSRKPLACKPAKKMVISLAEAKVVELWLIWLTIMVFFLPECPLNRPNLVSQDFLKRKLDI